MISNAQAKAPLLRPVTPMVCSRPLTHGVCDSSLTIGFALVALLVAASCHGSDRATTNVTAHQPTTSRSATTWQKQLVLAQQAELKRQHFEARAHYEEAHQLASTAQAQATVARQFADTLLSWGEFTDAQTQLELVVLHQPNQAAGWHDLGMVRYRLGLPAGAEVALRRAVTLAPSEPRPRIALAALFWATHRPADALREYHALRQLALPAAVRSKVDWAIAQLSPPATATPPATR